MTIYNGKVDITINKHGGLLIAITPENNKVVEEIANAKTHNASVVVLRNEHDKVNKTVSVMTRIHTA